MYIPFRAFLYTTVDVILPPGGIPGKFITKSPLQSPRKTSSLASSAVGIGGIPIDMASCSDLDLEALSSATATTKAIPSKNTRSRAKLFRIFPPFKLKFFALYYLTLLMRIVKREFPPLEGRVRVGSS